CCDERGCRKCGTAVLPPSVCAPSPQSTQARLATGAVARASVRKPSHPRGTEGCVPPLGGLCPQVNGQTCRRFEGIRDRPRSRLRQSSHHERLAVPSLRLREAQDPLTIRVFIIVGEDDRASGRAQLLGYILALADIAPLQPRAGAAGELAVAEMQPRLDQPKKRLVAHRKATAGGSSFEVGVANLARHLKAPRVQ